MEKLEVLKKYFGYDSFRGGQKELVTSILSGVDTVGIMPTGAGKSICFQLPALMLEGITIVISPLISLMKDQVMSLIQSGISSAYINSSLSKRQIDIVLDNARLGKYKLIYVAPERLLTDDFLEFARDISISMVTVDEAHCISQWGQDFRPSYALIPKFIDSLEKRPVISAFTATATQRVSEDIISILELNEPKVLVTGFDRKNLYLEVDNPKNKTKALFDFLVDKNDKSGIVYCLSRKNVEKVCEELKNAGYLATRYHAGLSDSERHENQDDFLFDRSQIMVATNAFGMGIDKSNVSYVVHYNMPKDIESYYQEAGRAGRDGSESHCLLLYSGTDVKTNEWMINNHSDRTYADEETEAFIKEQDRKRLKEMTFYSTTNDCLRGYILKYFGEQPTNFCGKCGNCDTQFETVDVTVDSQKIMSCVKRMGERFGAKLVIDVLRGSKSEKIISQGFDKLSTYGISDKSVHTLMEIMNFLVLNEYLIKTDSEYPVLQLGVKAREVLSQGKILEMKLAKEKVVVKKVGVQENTQKVVSEEVEPLYMKLKELRKEVASEQGVPTFVIFSDKTLVDMCVKLPKNPSEFLSIIGVGEVKLSRYGNRFLQVVEDFLKDNEELLSSGVVPKKYKRKKVKDLILPNEQIIEKIQTSKEPIVLSTINGIINEVMDENGCSKTTSRKLGAWLVSKGILDEVEKNGRTSKRVTKIGLDMGVIEEIRVLELDNRHYKVNLYSQSMQRFIIDNICEILTEYHK